MTLFDREILFAELRRRGLADWAELLQQRLRQMTDSGSHGSLSAWTDAYQSLPQLPPGEFASRNGRICADGIPAGGPDPESLHACLSEQLMRFHPWRKGPFELYGLHVDTEWRSDLKWNRLVSHVDLRNRFVLDVGCGNGYYGWQMLHAGADMVVGLDPFLLYLMQFEVLRRYLGPERRNYVLPGSDVDIPDRLHAFDVTFSMGVLYHRPGPVEHLQRLWHALKPRGQLVLETLVLESPPGRDGTEQVLVPRDRYAKMRNVWFIPSVPLLLCWLQRAGFVNAVAVDMAPTRSAEQRRTEWMTFESLSDFLDPDDSGKTIEGYPAPVRVIVTATRGGS